MESVLLVLEFVLTVLITIVVMLQKSSSIGLGAYSGSNETVFGAKGPAAFLAKVTMFFSILFVINTIALGYVYSTKNSHSVIDEAPKAASSKPAAPSAPVPPSVPAAE